VNGFSARYQHHWLAGARAKLGLVNDEDGDDQLATDFLALLASQRVDHTLAWRHLADAVEGEGLRLQALFEDARPLHAWLTRWQDRAQREARPGAERAAAMRRVSPLYIPRNHIVEDALSAASEDEDLQPLQRLLAVLAQPFDEQPDSTRYATPASPELTAAYRTFCGT
jgi:uncharacterized protein YdiU (UPF0061 family)